MRQEYNPLFLRCWRLAVRDQHVREFDLHSRYMDTARFDAGYKTLNDFTLSKRWAPFVSIRTETGSLLTTARGVEYRWPLLDYRLIQHFLATPTEEKYRRGMGRYLHRRAVSKLVPRKRWRGSQARTWGQCSAPAAVNRERRLILK